MTKWLANALSVSLLATLPAVAEAGSPLTCFPMSIGDAPSLPWGSRGGWNTPRADYDRARLVEDTLAVLGRHTPVLVRMETLRRGDSDLDRTLDAHQHLWGDRVRTFRAAR